MVKAPVKTKSKQDEHFEENDDALLFDMEAVEEGSFEVIPKGTYNAIIDEVEYKLSNSSGKPMWAISLTITDGAYEGRKLFTNISFSEKALPMAKTQIMRIAPEVISKRFDPRKIAESGELVHKLCRAKTKIEIYEGEERTRVQTLLAPAEGDDDGFAT